ncbi:unannotated protein [freshwater metagenome]|uniref:Unannotated protein n=1 Tax=freshwater metagenome TaxID=449393 RepID=A0A6J6CSI0_9ZZZZ|nr:hypothetical protein [Actinomycetota bacterium]
MSDLYRLALALRSADDAALSILVHERSLSLAEFKDFFDLAQAVLTPKSQALLVSSLSNSEIGSLRSLLAEEKVSKEQVSFLASDLFVWSSKEPVVYDWLAERLKENPRTASLRVVTEALKAPDQESIDRDCGIHAFEAMQSITELIFSLDQHFVREVSKGSMGLPDVKRLSSHLGKSKEYVKAILELAKVSGVVAISDKRFHPTDLADSWIGADPKTRWQLLVNAWLAIVGASGAKELALQHSQDPSKSLNELVGSSFPLVNASAQSRIGRIPELADAIGLSVTGFAASWLPNVLAGKVVAATKSLEQRLPAQQERIIVQADLSIIAPGPLSSSIEIELRKFTDTENIGLATGYRISPLSLSCGLEEGLTEKQIRALLEKLSGSPLPQPVDYLISETATRFGRLKIKAGESGSVLTSTDELLATQILMDSKLKAYGLRKSENAIVSSLEPESLYHALRDNGYLAIRVDQNDKVIAPSAIHKNSSHAAMFQDQLTRLRKQDLEIADQAPESDVDRKIQLALASKSILLVEINANGKVMNFVLEPIGLANGRLRARDRKADIERTLPVSAITSIVIG